MVTVDHYRNVLIALTGLLLLYCDIVAGQASSVDGDVRLRGGDNAYSGRVEIYHNGQWGTVCDDGWDMGSAVVTCRQMGFQSAVAAYSSAYFGQGTGDILLDNVECSGYETRLEDCNNNGWNVHNCAHFEDAGVECSYGPGMTTPFWWQGNGDVRLVEGSSPYEGRVEVYHNYKWNTVCDDSWDATDAAVVCKQLGYEGSAEALSNAYFGAGYGDIILDNVGCNGWESRLLQCSNSGLYVHDCSHREDAGVRCGHEDLDVTTGYGWQDNGDVRLVEGSSPYEGRVEIYYNYQWNTVCDDSWDYTDASVVCRQLGYQGDAEAIDESYFGDGFGDFLLDDVRCHGWESTLLECSHNGFYVNDCSHGETAGVRCGSGTTTPFWWQDNGDVRLVEGSSPYEGRVEVYHNYKWNTVCDDSWDTTDATVVCRQLGYEGFAEALSDAYFGAGYGDIILDNVGCNGLESTLLQCSNNGLYVHDCSHREDAGVRCGHEADDGSESKVRLANGDDESGRVEIYHYGEWGTVCDDGWSIQESDVVCRQLGYPAALSYEGNAYFGGGSGQIMLDDVDCDGSEHVLTQCDHSGWNNHNCDHSEDVSVICQTPVTYYPRLVDGYHWYEGRVEVWDGSRWENVCDESFYENEASTVCRQIGFPGYEVIYDGESFGSGNAPPSDVIFSCDYNNHELGSCYVYTAPTDGYCGSVAIRCTQSTSMQSGAITGIVIASVFLFVCICVGLVLSYQSSKRNRATSHHRLAVISGRDNLTGPSAYQINQNNIEPPTYNEVINSPIYRSQLAEPFPIPQEGLHPYPPQSNQGAFNASQHLTSNPSSKPNFLFSYPLDTSLGPAHTPPYPAHPSNLLPSHVGGPGEPSTVDSLLIEPSQNHETHQGNAGRPADTPGYATIGQTNPEEHHC